MSFDFGGSGVILLPVSLFAVHLSGKDLTSQSERVRRAYPDPDHYQLSDNAFLVVSSDARPQAIADKLELAGADDDATGIVFKLNSSYTGYESEALWEWLATARRRDE